MYVSVSAGGVGYTLGLIGYFDGDNIYMLVMICSSCLVCWGTLGTTLDLLGLLGLYQGKRVLLLPWLVWWVSFPTVEV